MLVSHSALLAAGVAELAAQMAPDVHIEAVGGSDGGLGTDFEAVSAALSARNAQVVLYDLGSARMTVELAIESLADPAHAVLVDAPLVEGAVAAAVAAQNGADLAEVASAARSAGRHDVEPPTAAAEHLPAQTRFSVDAEAQEPKQLSPVAEHVTAQTANQLSADFVARAAEQEHDQLGGAEVRRSVVVPNELGLHARPAAALARAAAELETTVTVAKGERTATATSVLELLGLDVRRGDVLNLTAEGDHAEKALTALATLIESGLGDFS